MKDCVLDNHETVERLINIRKIAKNLRDVEIGQVRMTLFVSIVERLNVQSVS